MRGVCGEIEDLLFLAREMDAFGAGTGIRVVREGRQGPLEDSYVAAEKGRYWG